MGVEVETNQENPVVEGDPPVDELAYEQASRALDQQAGVLNELRQRTSTLIAVTALVATFLGGEALTSRPADQGSSVVLAAGLAALLLGIAACLAVLAPTRTRKRTSPVDEENEERTARDTSEVIALAFSMNVETMLDRAEQGGLPFRNTMRTEAARVLQLAWDENQPIIASKQRVFVWACVALLAQTVSWITYIGLGREVI